MILMDCLRERLLFMNRGQRLAAPGYRCTLVAICGAVAASACYHLLRYSSRRAAAGRDQRTPVVAEVQRTASNAELLPADAEGQEDDAASAQRALQAVQQRSASVIQRAFRAHVERRMHKEALVQAATVLQAWYRGTQARQQYLAMRHQRAAVVIQAHWRGAAQRPMFQALRSAAVVVQDAMRAKQAAAKLHHLRASQAAAAQPQAAAAPVQESEDGGRRCYTLQFLKQQRPAHQEKPDGLLDGLWIDNPREAAPGAGVDQAVNRMGSDLANRTARPQRDDSTRHWGHGRDVQLAGGAAGNTLYGNNQAEQQAGGTGSALLSGGCPLPPARATTVVSEGMRGAAVANLPALHKTGSAFKVRGAQQQMGVTDSADPEEAKQKAFKLLLNQLTPDSFDKLSQKIVDVGVFEAKTLVGLINQVFEKALEHPHFCELYSKLCAVLHARLPELKEPDSEAGPKVNFRHLLLGKCQDEFMKGAAAMTSVAEQLAQQEERKARQRARGIVTFIGHLYNSKVLYESIVYSWIQRFLDDSQNPCAANIECLCQLLAAVGQELDTPQGKAGVHADQLVPHSHDTTSCTMMDGYFTRIKSLSQSDQLESRLRFMLLELIELRQKGWEARRKQERPVSIQEIHDAAKQEAAAVAQRDRRHHPKHGTSSGRVDGGGSFGGGGGDRARGAGPGALRHWESPDATMRASLGYETDGFKSMGMGRSSMCSATGSGDRVAAAAATAGEGSRLRQESKQHSPPTRREHLSDTAGCGWPKLTPSGQAAVNPDAFGFDAQIAASKEYDMPTATAAQLAGDGLRGGRRQGGNLRLRNGSQVEQWQQSGRGAFSLTATEPKLPGLPRGSAAAANAGQAAAARGRGWNAVVLPAQGAAAMGQGNGDGLAVPPGWGPSRHPAALTRLTGFSQSTDDWGAPPGFAQRAGAQRGRVPAAAEVAADGSSRTSSSSHRGNRAGRAVLYAAAQRAAASCSSQPGPFRVMS